MLVYKIKVKGQVNWQEKTPSVGLRDNPTWPNDELLPETEPARYSTLCFSCFPLHRLVEICD